MMHVLETRQAERFGAEPAFVSTIARQVSRRDSPDASPAVRPPGVRVEPRRLRLASA